MKKAWSLSTTVRNPERILPFLRVLKEMENEEFDVDGQAKFQILLIQNRLYQPRGLSNKLLGYYETSGDKMNFPQAEEVFEHMKSQSTTLRNGIGLRGRTSVAPITKMGLAIAKKSYGKVIITDLGNAFLNGQIDVGDVYFRFFIKWQIPNLESNKYPDDGAYDIKPFMGALHLINNVNQIEIRKGNKPKGLSKKEFGLFAPTLINYKNITNQAEKIIKLRSLLKGKNKEEQRKIFNDYKLRFASEFLETKSETDINKLLKNLKDYGDNAIRYFRLTRYIYIRGNGFYVDLEPRRSVEISNLLKYDNAESIKFSSKKEYINYITDISKPKLPWETKEEYIKVIKKLLEEISDYEDKLSISKKHEVNCESLSEKELKEEVRTLRKYRRDLQEKESHTESQNIDQIKKYIEKLENIHSFDDKPILLEKYVSLGLNALNDALKIKPNYPVGDDGEPTFTAPANTPDIECYYQSGNAICEVTMLNGRDQWYNEGQPVMRHLRDFEEKNKRETTYCLFIAPKLHRDTINTFWTAIKYEYEGKPQKIIPLHLKHFIEILKILITLKEKGVFLEHEKIFDLYEQIIRSSANYKTSSEWLESIPTSINSWKSELVS